MSKITYFAPDTDAYVESVMKHIEEFEKLTGDTVQFKIIPSDEYYSNQIQNYLAEEGCADVYMSGPILLWEHMAAGFVEPLDSYLLKQEDWYHFEEFIPNLICANRWTGHFGDSLGQGPLISIPINCESYNVAYHKPLFEKYNLQVPKTWSEYFKTAEWISKNIAGVRGFAQRGTTSWHTMFTGFATQYWSMGATDFDSEGHCAIASPEAIQITEQFIHALKQSGPVQWPEQRWYELALDFCDGKYGLIVDSDHYVAYYENSDISSMKGNVGYAPTPVNKEGKSVPNMYTWGLVMNQRSKEKETAWKFMQWASSKEFLLRAAFEGNMNPTRFSVWDDESFKEHVSGWGDFSKVSRKLAEEDGKVLVTPSVNYRIIAERWVKALLEAYETGNVKKALEAAAKDIDQMVL